MVQDNVIYENKAYRLSGNARELKIHDLKSGIWQITDSTIIRDFINHLLVENQNLKSRVNTNCAMCKCRAELDKKAGE